MLLLLSFFSYKHYYYYYLFLFFFLKDGRYLVVYLGERVPWRPVVALSLSLSYLPDCFLSVAVCARLLLSPLSRPDWRRGRLGDITSEWKEKLYTHTHTHTHTHNQQQPAAPTLSSLSLISPVCPPHKLLSMYTHRD